MESTNDKAPRAPTLEALKVQISKLTKKMIAQMLNSKHLYELFLILLWTAVAFACLLILFFQGAAVLL